MRFYEPTAPLRVVGVLQHLLGPKFRQGSIQEWESDWLAGMGDKGSSL